MKTFRVCFVAVLAVLPTFALADSFLSERSIRYTGDQEGRDVCRAIVHDSAPDLKRLLRRYKNHLPGGYQFELTGKAVAGSFACDGKGLLAFAHEIGAENIAGYLQGGTVIVEEYLSSVD